jgi:hypothetical protein
MEVVGSAAFSAAVRALGAVLRFLWDRLPDVAACARFGLCCLLFVVLVVVGMPLAAVAVCAGGVATVLGA